MKEVQPPLDRKMIKRLAPVVQTLGRAIRRIKVHPVDNAIDFHNTYQQDSDLSGR